MSKVKKERLIPVKELRQVVVPTLKSQVSALELLVHTLKEDVASLEGARRNLKMMYDSHERELETAKLNGRHLQEDLKESRKQTERAIEAAERYAARASKYEADGAFATWVRSLKLAFAPLGRLAAKLKIRRGK